MTFFRLRLCGFHDGYGAASFNDFCFFFFSPCDLCCIAYLDRPSLGFFQSLCGEKVLRLFFGLDGFYF